MSRPVEAVEEEIDWREDEELELAALIGSFDISKESDFFNFCFNFSLFLGGSRSKFNETESKFLLFSSSTKLVKSFLDPLTR